MNERLIFKIVVIGILVLLSLIPQFLLGDLVEERRDRRQEAYESVERSWPGEQVVAGPLLTVPYQLATTVRENVRDSDGKEREVLREVTEQRMMHLVPSRLEITGDLRATVRERGIYPVPLYVVRLELSGAFDLRPLRDRLSALRGHPTRLLAPRFAVAIRDPRGISRPEDLRWQGGAVAFSPGTHLPGSEEGLHAQLPELDPDGTGTFDFGFTLELRGMRALGFALLAEASSVHLTADWPHPSFNGALLPESREVSAEGFSARWRASSFSMSFRETVERCEDKRCAALLMNPVGFELLQPVDVYRQSERSMKYAVLFVLLTFVALMLFELKRQSLHPVQYLLVAMALLVFFLLLISLSEHIPFWLSYVIASAACTALLTFYFGEILGSRGQGLRLGGGLVVLYAALYGILQSEGSALLLGSLLVFTALVALIVATRKVDWYALTTTDAAPGPGQQTEEENGPSPS